MRSYTSMLVLAVFLVLGIGVVLGSKAVATKLITAQGDTTPSCKTVGQTHDVRIENNTLTPRLINARRCDRMRITNLDPLTREIGFGNHEAHVPYDGVAERILRQNQSLTVTLIQAGTYHFHDHFHDEVAGVFIVAN